MFYIFLYHFHLFFFCNIHQQVDVVWTEFDFGNDLWYVIDDWEMTVKIATFVPIILLGMIGNGMMLNIIVRNRALQTPTNLLLANMAAADLAMITICPILFMFNNFYQDFRLGEFGCKAEGFLEGIKPLNLDKTTLNQFFFCVRCISGNGRIQFVCGQL